jgi:hypothetical protein
MVTPRMETTSTSWCLVMSEKQELSPKEYRRLVDLTGRHNSKRDPNSARGQAALQVISDEEESERRALERRLDFYGRS